MFQKNYRWCAVLTVAMTTGFAGCESQEGAKVATAELEQPVSHSHADVSEGATNFSTAFEDIEAMKNKICQAFANGTPDDAHDTLHDVGRSLEKLPELAAEEAKLSNEQLAAVNEAVESLFDGFGKLDDTMHGGEEVDVKELEEKLTQALTKLKETVK